MTSLYWHLVSDTRIMRVIVTFKSRNVYSPARFPRGPALDFWRRSMSRHAMPFVFALTAIVSGAASLDLLAFGQEQPPPAPTIEAQATTMAKAERPDSAKTDSTSAGSTTADDKKADAAAPEAQPAGPPAPAPPPLAVTS